MDTLDSAATQAGERIAIYDQRDTDSAHGLDFHERVAACYRWASARGHVVLDQFIAYDDPGDAPPAALKRALQVCAESGAALLVYASDCLGRDLADTLAQLGTRSLLTVHCDRDAALCGGGRGAGGYRCA